MNPGHLFRKLFKEETLTFEFVVSFLRNTREHRKAALEFTGHNPIY